MKKKYLFSSLIVGLFALGFAASDEPNPSEPNQPKTDIPSDSQATPNPTIEGEPSGVIPNIQGNVTVENGDLIFRIDMTGIKDPKTNQWLSLLGTSEANQNFWIEIDGDPKGVKIYNISDNNQHTVPVDLVFLVDNSGSMSEEANTVANELIDWANDLAQSGLNIRFACVGFDGAINGAIDFTTAENLSEWLNDGWGTDRTRGFAGPNADALKSVTENYRTGGNSANECGVAALRFADENFSFTKGSNRIYINFTDEPNQNNRNDWFSVESLKTDWVPQQGTVHLIYSDSEYSDRNECNRLMAEYTGGTYQYTDPRFTGVHLIDLEVTGAMSHSYIIRVANIGKYMDGKPHDIHITIKTPDGNVRVERHYSFTIAK